MTSEDTEVRNRKDFVDNSNEPLENIEIKQIYSKIKWDDIIEKGRHELLNTVIESITNEFDVLKEVVNSDQDNINYDIVTKTRGNKDDAKFLPEKTFIRRDSVLTNLLKISHIRTVYHMFVAALIIFSLNTMLTDCVEKGGLIHIYHLEWIFWAFGQMGDVITAWLCLQLTSLMVYPIFLCWLYIQHDNDQSLIKTETINKVFLIIYVLFQVFHLLIPLKFIILHGLPPCSSAILVLENIRFIMKTHAFIRHNTLLELSKEQPNMIDQLNFSHYLYFLFAPTLVYRSNYPRTPTIRWPYVVSNFAQVIFCIVYMYYILARFCAPYFQNFNSTHISLQKLIVSIFGCMLPGTMVLLICFFCFLHSWLNAFAEMLRFADRLFYKEWWNSTTFSNYYRTWNVVVHDWLYTYIYRDLMIYSNIKSRSFAMTIVFLVSALVHEYVLIVIFRFFFPVLFVLFGGAGFGMMFLKGRSRHWNIGFWVAMFIGTGILLCLYSMEWYARINCKLYFHRFIDILIPRILFCQ